MNPAVLLRMGVKDPYKLGMANSEKEAKIMASDHDGDHHPDEYSCAIMEVNGRYIYVCVLTCELDYMVSRPEEFHLRPLSERCGSLSTHTAPIKQTRPRCLAASVQTDAVAFPPPLRGSGWPASCAP